MKIFIDSADLDEIKLAYGWGLAEGVTTNPSLIKKAVEKRKKSAGKTNLEIYIKQILKVARRTPVSLEVTETTAAGMIKQGKSIYLLFNKVAGNVYIKIPVNPAFKNPDFTPFDGILAIKELSRNRIPVNCTLIFTPEQALLAAKAGAALVSPFAGRLDDYLREKNKIKFQKSDYYPAEGKIYQGKLLQDNGIVSGIHLVRECVQILKQYRLKTEVLAASLRNPRQVREAALAGADIATLPLSVIQDMLKHPQTYQGMKKFTEDIVPEYVKITRQS